MQGMVKPSRAAEEEKRVDVIEMEIMSDHVHLLCNAD
jgi:REP element-mobilizing transposase RayT